MKLPAFRYLAPTSVQEASDLLAEYGDEASVLAGGQSLILEMRYEVRRPSVIVDINRIPGLDAVVERDGGVEIGALVRHRTLERAGATPGRLGDLFAEVAPWIAHPPIRNRGTFVGSVSWAHPSAEWCATAIALGAEIVLVSSAGVRTVAAAEWFRGWHRTDRAANELVIGVRVPPVAASAGFGFLEQRRTHATLAMVAVVAVVDQADGKITDARIGLAGAADRSLRATAAEDVLRGEEPSARLVAAAAKVAADHCDPVSGPHAPAAYRRHVVEVFTRRTLTRAIGPTAMGPS